MSQLARRLDRLENGHGAGAKSKILTDSEAQFIIFSCNLGKPKEEWITRNDINDDDFRDEAGRFPWRISGPANGVGIHLYALRKVNERKK